MKKRIFLLHPGVVPQDRPYFQQFEKTLGRIKGPDTEISHKMCPPGVGNYPVVDYFMNALEVPAICKGAIEAEEEGADAIIIACTDDPGLRIVRTLVDIPVIGETESALHLACMMGHRFGLVSWPTRPFMARGENLIMLYGLEARAIPNPMEPVMQPSPTAEREASQKGGEDPVAFCQEYLVPAARNLIKRGAEIVIIHSTGLSLMAENAGLSSIEDPGIPTDAERASVPVLNVVSIALKMAEMRIDLQRTLGMPSASRIGLYQKVDSVVREEKLRTIRDSFERGWQSPTR